MTEQTFGVDQPILGDVVVPGEGDDGAPAFHTILEVWREVLTPGEAIKNEKITPQWATRMVSKYAGLTFQDMPDFRDRYFAKVEELLQRVVDVIDADPECVNLTTPEEDAEINSRHYVDLLTEWQILVLGWEMDWDCTDPAASAELAAISETHTMFFGSMGLTSLLDNIPFQYTDMHKDALALALQSYKEGREGGGE